jgi:hypothetical protein
MDLIKIIAEYLFDRGFQVAYNNRRINLYFVKYGEYDAVSKIICEIGPSSKDKDVWGYFYKKPTAITVNDEATYIDEWCPIGNIHDPEFLDNLAMKMEIELRIADTKTVQDWVEQHSRRSQ